MALTQKEIDEMARATIRGDYGNGTERKQNLGANYDVVQKRVNELSKQSGGASNVKAPSSSNATKTTTTVSAPKANASTTTTAKVKTVSKSTPQIMSNEQRKNKEKAGLVSASNSTKQTGNATQTTKPTTASAKPVKTQNTGTITVQKLDGSTKKVANGTVTIPSLDKKYKTNTVNTERARKKYEQKIGHTASENILTDEDNEAISMAVSNLGTGKQFEDYLDVFTPTKGLQEKYGMSARELLDMYTKDKERKDNDFANKHKVVGTALASGKNIVQKPILSGATVLSDLVNPEISKKSEEMYGNTLRQVTGDVANLKGGVTRDMGNVGKTAYNMGTGLAENLIPKALGTPFWIATSALNAAGDSMLSAQDRGVDKRKAAGEGLVSGAIDAALNVKGLDAIKGLQSTGSTGKDLLKQMTIGGGEQAITDIAQRVADSIIAGDNSIAKTTFDSYKAQGLDDDTAFLNTVKDIGGEFLTNVGTGALIGGAIGSGRKLLSDVVNPRIPSIFTPENRVDAVVDNAETPNYRWGRTADRLIPQDSYARTPEYMDLDNQYKTNFEQIEQLKQRRTELNNALATESAPKPREEWNTQDEIQALLGDTPMNYTENGNRMLAELDGIKRNISDLESRNSLINEDRDLIKGNTRVNRLENYTPKEFVPATRENYQGFSTTKGVHNDLVQSGKAQLVEMSPEEYIRRCADEIFKDDVATLESVISSRDQKNIDKYAQMMKEGTEFDTPYLDYDSSNQEGLHRALAAYEAGLDVMPVVVKGTPYTGDLDFSAKNRISEINNARFDRENPIEDMDIDDEILFDGLDIPNPSQLEQNAFVRNVADEDLNNALKGRLKGQTVETTPNETLGFNQNVADSPRNVSRVYDSLKNSSMFKSAENMAQLEYAKKKGAFNKQGGVENRKATMETAIKEFAENPDKVFDDVLNKEWTNGGKDLDKSMICLKTVLDDPNTDFNEVNDFLRNQSVHISNAARELRANQDYVGTREGTLQKTAQYMNESANKTMFTSKGELTKSGTRAYNVAESCLNNNFNGLKRTYNMDDANVQYIRDAVSRGASRDDIALMLGMYEKVGTTHISDEAISKVNDIYNEIEKYGENSKQRAKLEQEAYAVLAKDVCAKKNFIELWDSWRYLAMLGNTRTHVRNVLGNTMHYAVTEVKDNVASAIEGIADTTNRALGGNGIERQRAMLNRLDSADNNLVKASRLDADNEAYRLLNDMGGNKYNEFKSDLMANRPAFNGNKPLNAINEFNSWALDAEDYFGLKNKYSKAMARYLKANGKDASIFKSTDKADIDFLDKARMFAADEAKQATFHSYSKVADVLTTASSNLRNSDSLGAKASGYALEGLLPFKKTPINILKQGIKYSPASLLKAVKTGIDAVSKGTKNASDVIDDISSGLTGTGIMALGALLYEQGLLTGSADEDYNLDNAETMQGKQNYALKIGDNSYTLDWLAPFALPLFTGVALVQELTKSGEDEGDALDSLINAITTLGEPITEMSMLSGLNDTLESLSQGVGNAVGSFASNTLTGYATQGIPTLLGQVARSVDDTRRSTFVPEKAGFKKQVLKQGYKAMNKIPFLSKLNEPYIDAQGNEAKNFGNSIPTRLLYNMFSPGYVQQGVVTPTDNELNRLYDLTGEKGLYSGVTSGKIGNDYISREDNTRYQRLYGSNNRALTDAITSNENYSQISDINKSEIIKDAYSYSKAFADYEIGGKEMSGKTKELYDVYKSQGIEGVANALINDAHEQEQAYQYGFTKKDGKANTDSYNKAYEVFGGDEAKIKMYGNVENAFNDGHEKSFSQSSYEDVCAFLNEDKSLTDEQRGEILYARKGGEFGKDATKAYKDGGYAGLWNYYNNQKKSGSSKKTQIPSPSDLSGDKRNTAFGNNAIEAGARAYQEKQDAIENFVPSDYVTKTQYGSLSFDRTKALPMLDEIYKEDNVAKSRAIIESGANTNGVKATRSIMGDDYVYDYYNIENNADYDGNKNIKKAELLQWLQSQGRENEFDAWWQVFKSK